MSDNYSRLEEPTLEGIFAPGGILESCLPNYEYRPSQLTMAEAVLDAIQNRHHLCVEAGTGTGKTLAYLIPSLFSNKRVIVSTVTKNLQDQLFLKDIPFIRRHLFPDLRVTCMKGRSNYLCLKKLYDQAGDEPEELQEHWNDLLAWTEKTQTGDRSELNWMGDDDSQWRHLDARSDTCTGQKCPHFGQCYVTRMRQKALESDLIIVNHALFFANLALETDEIGRALPNFSVLILDEAQGVENVATSHFGKQLSNYQMEALCQDFRKLASEMPALFDLIDRVETAATLFFGAFPLSEGRHSLNFYQDPKEGTVDLRNNIGQPCQRLQNALLALLNGLEQYSSRPSEADPLERRLEQTMSTLEEIFNPDPTNNVYWFERRLTGIFLHMNPINIAPALEEHLFSRTDTAIFTSATLTSNDGFKYFKTRLGIPQPREVVTDSEFDYTKQAILYVPNIPKPNSHDYFSSALHEIHEILAITDGNAFLLFTSFAQMNRVYETLRQTTSFPLLRQGDQSKNHLLNTFRETPHAVLCATSSFWQGIDVPGDTLRAVVIDKLPFLVPTEPMVAARINWLEKRGENSFLQYSVPEATITLRQGLGRLIRSRQDRGILAVLDSRLWSHSYGQLFLQSLPNCPVTDSIGELQRFYHEST
ncbi:MAG: ATP-dependent DNA helicase [Acidobacteriota bacterium]|nr:ATP-dependent DNA helicase [Acidobacteriota bacterium]